MRANMIDWSKKFLPLIKQIEENSNMDVTLYPKFVTIYVDDLDAALKTTPNGLIITNELTAEICETKLISDEFVPNDTRTFLIFQQIANMIDTDIEMTYDVPSAHDCNMCPILDTQMWTEEINGVSKIKFLFYEKPMASKYVIHYLSALPDKCKQTILTQEGLRRLRNSSRDTPIEVIN